MAHTKAAMKAYRKSLKAYALNSAITKKIKDIRKKAQRAITSKNKDAAMKLYLELQKVVDKASKHSGFLKKNTAGRYKSSLMRTINALGR